MVWIWITLGVLLILGISLLLGYASTKDPHADEGIGIVVSFFSCIVLGLIWLFSAGMYHMAQYPDDSVTASEVLKAEGIDLNGAQHLELGSSIVGNHGDVSGLGVGGVFSSYFTLEGSSRPASSVRLGVHLGGYSHIMEVDYSDVAFKEVANATPSAIVTLDNSDAAGLGRDCGYWIIFEPCKTNQESFAEKGNETPVNPGKLVQDHLEMITVTLPPEQYQKYLTGSGVTK